MTHTKRITSVAFAAVPLVALAVAGCGGGTSSPPAAAAAPKTTASRVATVRVANTGLGKVLVDSHGRTLYLFKKDTGKTSTCTGACAQAWPPLQVAGKPTVGSRARSSLLGTTQRSDGTRQITYNGHPLYTFQSDTKGGDTNGEGVVAFGAAWFVVSPAGKQISGKASSSARASNSTPRGGSAKPAPEKTSPSSSGIPQNNGGDQDSDNNGGPDDGDGGI